MKSSSKNLDRWTRLAEVLFDQSWQAFRVPLLFSCLACFSPSIWSSSRPQLGSSVSPDHRSLNDHEAHLRSAHASHNGRRTSRILALGVMEKGQLFLYQSYFPEW